MCEVKAYTECFRPRISPGSAMRMIYFSLESAKEWQAMGYQGDGLIDLL